MGIWYRFFASSVFACSMAAPVVADDKVWTFSYPSLNLREYPEISAKVIATIPYGTHVKGLVIANPGKYRWSEWRRVEYQEKQGWVYNVFLTENPIEPMDAIVVLSSSKSALQGTWYFFSPFGIGSSKFPRGEVAASSGLTFESAGKLVVHDYDGNSGGTWNLEGSNLKIVSSGSDDQYSGFEIEGASQFYKIRDDWIVLEIASEDKIGETIVPRFYFMTKPLNVQTKKEVEEWTTRETR